MEVNVHLVLQASMQNRSKIFSLYLLKKRRRKMVIFSSVEVEEDGVSQPCQKLSCSIFCANFFPVDFLLGAVYCRKESLLIA